MQPFGRTAPYGAQGDGDVVQGLQRCAGAGDGVGEVNEAISGTEE